MLIQIPNWTIPLRYKQKQSKEGHRSLQLEHLEEEDDVKTEDLDKIWLAYWHIDSLPIDVNKAVLTWLE